MRPTLSVIITTYNARDTIRACLEALCRQETETPFEIVVVDSSTDGTADIIAENFPEVRLLRFSERKFCGGARNHGVSMAKADIIAFTDADCTVSEGWIEAVLRAHERPDPVIGGAIAPAMGQGVVGWAAYFSEFSHWMPGTPAGTVDDVAGANMSYKKAVFDRYGKFVEGTYCSDSEFHWRLQADGQRPRFDPSMAVRHHCINRLGHFLAHEFNHGRSFGRVRTKARHYSGWRRAAYVVLWPLVASKVFGTVFLNNLGNMRYIVPFIAALPLTFLGIVCWVAGETWAYAKLEGK